MISRRQAILRALMGVVPVIAKPQALAASAVPGRPNIIVILLDDLDTASVATMDSVDRHFGATGATFSRCIATTPICGPSRASILTGQYAHNHGVFRNTGDDAGFAAFLAKGNEDHTIATTLHDGGYRTGLIGKYLNGYALAGDQRAHVPPGWDRWVAGVGHDAYGSFNYDLNVDGEVVHYGRDATDYMTDVLAGYALDFLDQAAAGGQPFFLYLAPYAPHSPATPAPRDKGKYRGASAPRTPSFNERNVRDKPRWVRKTPLMTAEKIDRVDADYAHRLETLLAVDDMIDAVMARLDQRGLLDTTYILFLSDNGYFMGEHRQPHGKDAAYDPASRVPLMVRGPGVAAGATIDRIALTVDLFPTIADFAGITPPPSVDGRSLAPLLHSDDRHWRDMGLIEGFGKEQESLESGEVATPAFKALRGERVLYVENETGERELYDLAEDPDELSNQARGAPKEMLRAYSRSLAELASCQGRTCSRLDAATPANRSLGVESNRRARKRRRSADQPAESSGTGARTAPTGNEVVPIGGNADAVAQLRLIVPRHVAEGSRLQLRVYLAAVTAPGTLVATLDTASPGSRGASDDAERLGSAPVNGTGWVTLDISTALGDSDTIDLTLRAEDGAAVAMAAPGSEHAPEVIPGHGRVRAHVTHERTARARPRAEHRRQRARQRRKNGGQQRRR